MSPDFQVEVQGSLIVEKVQNVKIEVLLDKVKRFIISGVVVNLYVNGFQQGQNIGLQVNF